MYFSWNPDRIFMVVDKLILREYCCGVAPHSSWVFSFFGVDFSYIRLLAEVFTYQSPFQLRVKDQHSSGALWVKLGVG